MAEPNNERKNYSFLNVKEAISSAKKPYMGVTASGLICNATEVKYLDNGRACVNASILIQGQSRTLGKLFPGVSFNESGDAWADLSFYGKTALRFAKFVERHPRPVIVVTGSIGCRTYVSDKDGAEHTVIRIYGDDFLLIRDCVPANASVNASANASAPRGENVQAYTPTKNAAPADTANAAPARRGSVDELYDDYEIVSPYYDEDEDVPF